MTGVGDCCINCCMCFISISGFVIVKVSPILSRLNKTVDNVNHSLEVITKMLIVFQLKLKGY